MDETRRRKQIRKDISSWGWALLIYYLLMNVSVTAAVMLQMVWEWFVQIISGNPEAIPEMNASNAWGYLVACGLAVLFIRLWKGKTFFGGMWQTNQEMKTGKFFQLLSIFVSGQMLIQFCAPIQEMVLNRFGLSILEAMERATGGSDSLSMFLYLALGAPIVEEIIFRGAILRGLEKYGKRFAILISALLFGLFHGNIIQSPYAFVVGLVLGYVAMEYSIYWAMVLHMINNLVLGDMLGRLTSGLGETGSAAVLVLIIWLSAVCAVISLVRNRKEIAAYHRDNKLDWSCMGPFATAPGILVLIVLMEFNAISMLFLL